jgi:putative ATP-dependent endonuclease of OLD family
MPKVRRLLRLEECLSSELVTIGYIYFAESMLASSNILKGKHMRISKIAVENFRLLKNTVVDLEENLSVIIGKNNCGKTSLLLVFDKFLAGHLSKSNFSFDDFNSDFKDELEKIIANNIAINRSIGILLRVFIEYSETDNLSNIGDKVIMELDPENKTVILEFTYAITDDKVSALRNDYKNYNAKRLAASKQAKNIFDFLRDKHQIYFSITRKSIKYDLKTGLPDEDTFVDLDKEKIKIENIIAFKWISASRNVSNKDADKSLSSLSSKIYQKLEGADKDSEVIEEFKETLGDTDEELNKVYGKLFEEVIDDVKKFGGLKNDESIVKIVSSLSHRDLLDENTTVMYGLGNGAHSLPENYNGLGYLNLISMIFEIKLKLHDFHREENEKLADINLFFIEEPEAHTHPQLQRVFIKNIKTLLNDGILRKSGASSKLQTVLSTHSAHIVSDSDFEDIKYFKRMSNGVTSKNLKDLKDYYDDAQHYTFLKQYLTIHRSELFFADKAIFIEGDTERILLPAFMRKVDQVDMIDEIENGLAPSTPLLSQNISTVEVGAYSHIFERFIAFIGVHSVIITDIDSERPTKVLVNGVPVMNGDGTEKMTSEKCRVVNGASTSNASLKYFYGSSDLAYFSALPLADKVLKKDSGAMLWTTDPLGNMICAYQIPESDADGNLYHARSFEDAFFHCNKSFMKSKSFDGTGEFVGAMTFPSLTQKWMKKFANDDIDPYEFAASGISSKPSLAMEILLNSSSREIVVSDLKTGQPVSIRQDFVNWCTPAYIEEALQWLKRG